MSVTFDAPADDETCDEEDERNGSSDDDDEKAPVCIIVCLGCFFLCLGGVRLFVFPLVGIAIFLFGPLKGEHSK